MAKQANSAYNEAKETEFHSTDDRDDDGCNDVDFVEISRILAMQGDFSMMQCALHTSYPFHDGE